MLGKDLSLRRAILDLIDNSIDGAKRLRGNARLDGLWIRIETTPSTFKITDNCGGISVDIARNYAFRFGRPVEMEATPHSIGQFGVGMKRSLFKLGKQFEIESVTKFSKFIIDVNVDEWKLNPKWEFEFKELQEGVENSLDSIGTKITVTSLHSAVSNEFTLENFIAQLRNDLASAYSNFIAQGLSITLNVTPVNFYPTDLLTSKDLQPAYQEVTMNEQDKLPLTIKMYTGIGKSEPQDAGWYIYCNGRLVLGPDQTIVTGWGEKGSNSIPKFHNQFSRFRGYVFFDSDDASRLPWNTLKTGVDTDSVEYRGIRQKMLSMARPVIDFLNELDNEKDTGDTQRTNLVEKAEKAKETTKAEVALPLFEFKIEDAKPVFKPTGLELGVLKPKEVTISYKRPIQDVEKIKECLKVTNYREVGEKTFEYYKDMECEE